MWLVTHRDGLHSRMLSLAHKVNMELREAYRVEEDALLAEGAFYLPNKLADRELDLLVVDITSGQCRPHRVALRSRLHRPCCSERCFQRLRSYQVKCSVGTTYK